MNAGHNPPILVSPSGSDQSGLMTLLDSTGILLGIDEDAAFTQSVIQLRSGDFIVLYTDGVTEAIDAEEDQFGMERLQGVLLENQDRPASEIAEALEMAIDQFSLDLTSHDDITLVIAKRLQK